MVTMTIEGAEMVKRLLAMDVTMWEIHRHCGVSYQTAKAWCRGWWKPDAPHSRMLEVLYYQKRQQFTNLADKFK